MEKAELILTAAKDIYIARAGKDLTIKSLNDAVKVVQDALKLITVT